MIPELPLSEMSPCISLPFKSAFKFRLTLIPFSQVLWMEYDLANACTAKNSSDQRMAGH